MEWIERLSEDVTGDNVEALLALFPDVATEVCGEDGELHRAVDYDALREKLGDVAEGSRERYQFTWPGKREARAEASRRIDKVLRPCPEESKDWDTTQNLYIEGDNLDALKILRKNYAGKIKMIYIDPPYNTGNDFIYDDDFAISREEYDGQSGDFDERGRLVENRDSNGRFHSDWCSMMLPRLLLARDLLTDDGVIFISIDDGEQKNIREMGNEVFGPTNFITQFIWRKVDAPNDNKVAVTPDHEYIIAYAKNLTDANLHQRVSPDLVEAYKMIDEDGRRCRDRLLRKNGKNSLRSDRPTMWFGLTAPDGSEVWPVREDGREGRWAAGRKAIDQANKEGRLIWKKRDSGWVPYTREYAPDDPTKPWMTIWNDLPAMRQTKSELLDLFGVSNIFDTPKPTALIQRLIELLDAKGSIVLDFFSGSGSTADAVLRSNSADGRENRFILVQLDEECAEGAIAHSIGLHTITEIGKERIRRAGAKITAEIEDINIACQFDENSNSVLDIGFRVLKIDTSNYEDVALSPLTAKQDSISGWTDNIKPDRTSLDLLFSVFGDLAIPYSARIEILPPERLSGHEVFSVKDGTLVACFDENLDNATIESMAKLQPSYCVVRDASFVDDAAAANFEELFKTFSPDTQLRVL